MYDSFRWTNEVQLRARHWLREVYSQCERSALLRGSCIQFGIVVANVLGGQNVYVIKETNREVPLQRHFLECEVSGFGGQLLSVGNQFICVECEKSGKKGREV